MRRARPLAGGAEDLSESGLVLRAAERERAGDRLDRLRAEGDQQLVVRQLSGRRLDDLPIRVDRSRGRPGQAAPVSATSCERGKR